MMKITGLSHLFKWENLHNWWLTKYFFAPLYFLFTLYMCVYCEYVLCIYKYTHMHVCIFKIFTCIYIYITFYMIYKYVL